MLRRYVDIIALLIVARAILQGVTGPLLIWPRLMYALYCYTLAGRIGNCVRMYVRYVTFTQRTRMYDATRSTQV